MTQNDKVVEYAAGVVGGCRQNPQLPKVVMKDYVTWLEGLPHQLVFVAYPTGFGFTFVY